MLKAPMQEEDEAVGSTGKRYSPCGGVASPLLANLFLHYALDRWFAAHYPQVPFERQADDVPRALQDGEGSSGDGGRPSLNDCRAADWSSIRRRRKSSIARTIFGRESTRTRSLILLAKRFSPDDQRIARGKFFNNFSPAVSNTAAKAIRDTLPVAGNCPSAVTKPSKTCRGCSIRLSGAGSNITGDSIALHCTRRCANWTEILSFGPSGNTKEAAPPSPRRSGTLDRTHLATRSAVVRSLADGDAAGLHDGSCMS